MELSAARNCSVYSGSLILINAAHPYRDTLTEHFLVPVNEENREVLLERRAAALLDRLMADIHGWSKILAVSGWRSEREQQRIWDDSIKENGAAFTQKYVAVPGHSEHQTGLAIDLGLRRNPVDFIRPDFPYSGICQTFRGKAARYGFIQRYSAGKECVTGIAQEPWHFRYVGIPHAEIMTGFRLTLEEYHSFLKRFPFGERSLVYEEGNLEFEISYLPADAGANLPPEAESGISGMVSGNNTDGYIVTKWKSHGN